MKLVPFDRHNSEAMVDLLSLYESWGHPECCPTPDALPKCGWTVPGVAACFLYETDSSSCFLDNAIVKRGEPGHTDAISAIVEKLLEEAGRRGFRKVYANTGNHAAANRAVVLGFKPSTEPYRMQLEREVPRGQE